MTAVILFLMVFVPTFLIVFHLFTKKYLNPYKLIFIFGKKGSGKSTLLTKYALDYMNFFKVNK